MANVFEPPSCAQLKFSLRRREEGELPLAFRCSLLALAQAAYPDLYGRALDSMALGKLLDLARELGIALSINNDRQITSLAVAENIQAHLSLRQRPQMAASAGVSAPDGGATSQGVDTLAALAMPDHRGRGAGGRRPEQRGRPGPSRPQEADTVACFRCGQRGHIERGCRNAPGAFGKGTPPSPRHSLASGPGPKASRDASSAQPLPSPHASSGARAHRHGVVLEGLRKPLEMGSTETGILLSLSSYFSRTKGLVGALTAVSGGQYLFLQVLNSGPLPVVVPAGAVLAHATPAPPPESAAPDGGVVAGVMCTGDPDA
ncbi:unnamed protein product [Lampetra planeri]